MMLRPLAAPGQQFGRWTIIGRAPTRRTPRGSYLVYWECRCECGATSQVQQRHLVGGRSLSCGCWKREAAVKQKTTHGARRTPLYEVWTQMLQRCSNPRNKSYKRYGARGIDVAPEWNEFATFRSWAETHGYADGLTIDREDNDGPYAPANCRWIPNVDNCRNNSVTLKVLWDGEQVPLNTLAEAHGLKPHTVYARYQRKGWTLRQALGLDPAPSLVRAPISEATRQRMRASALRRWQAEREQCA